jgi:hypothetical protein
MQDGSDAKRPAMRGPSGYRKSTERNENPQRDNCEEDWGRRITRIEGETERPYRPDDQGYLRHGV